MTLIQGCFHAVPFTCLHRPYRNGNWLEMGRGMENETKEKVKLLELGGVQAITQREEQWLSCVPEGLSI